MTAWSAYAMAVGCVLGLAAHLCERGLRHLYRPARHVWAGVMAATALVGGIGPLGWVVVRSEVPVAALWIPAVWAVASAVALTSLRISAWTLRRNGRGWRYRQVDGHRVLVSSSFGPGVVGGWRPRIVLPARVVAAFRQRIPARSGLSPESMLWCPPCPGTTPPISPRYSGATACRSRPSGWRCCGRWPIDRT